MAVSIVAMILAGLISESYLGLDRAVILSSFVCLVVMVSGSFLYGFKRREQKPSLNSLGLYAIKRPIAATILVLICVAGGSQFFNHQLNHRALEIVQGQGDGSELIGGLRQISWEYHNDRLRKVRPNVEALNTISNALNQVISAGPTTPVAWQAASQVISSRPAYPGARLKPSADVNGGSGYSEMPSCASRFSPSAPTNLTEQQSQNLANQNGWMLVILQLRDCTFDLDLDNQADMLQYLDKAVAKYPPNARIRFSLSLDFDRVTVKYRGGTLVPIAKLHFKDCSFDFDVNQEPPQGARFLITKLLAQNFGTNDFAVTFVDWPHGDHPN